MKEDDAPPLSASSGFVVPQRDGVACLVRREPAGTMRIVIRHAITIVTVVIVLVVNAQPSQAQGDEIQVYDGGLAPVGVFNLTLHNNFTPQGLKTPSFDGGVTPDHSFNGVPEWALGVTRWFEAGLYLPLYTYDKTLGFGIDGFKLRTLFARPDAAERRFVYGVNMEFSFNARQWDTNRFTSEVRPILGWHVSPSFDLILNPIVDTAYDGFGNLEFVPAVRVAFNRTSNWALAIETYSDFGRFNDFSSGSEQTHQIYGVIDHVTNRGLEIEFGAGAGITEASDRFTLKLILAKDLNKK